MCESWGDLDAPTTWVVTVTHASLHGFVARLLRAGLVEGQPCVWGRSLQATSLLNISPAHLPTVSEIASFGFYFFRSMDSFVQRPL